MSVKLTPTYIDVAVECRVRHCFQNNATFCIIGVRCYLFQSFETNDFSDCIRFLQRKGTIGDRQEVIDR